MLNGLRYVLWCNFDTPVFATISLLLYLRVYYFSFDQGGRQDPMVKLKKQLAEKEKALGDEQEAHQAIQSKLKELRTELNVEKHTNRQLEETLNARQMDLQALNARLQAMAEEKQNFSKQLQQVRLFSFIS